MTILKTLLYWGLLLAFSGANILIMGSRPADFLDIPSALFVLAGIFFSLINFRLSEIFQAFTDVLRQASDVPAERWLLDRKVLCTLSAYAFLAGGAGTLICVILSLGNIDSVERLMPALAVSFYPLLYAWAFKLFFLYPLQIALEKRLLLYHPQLAKGA